MRLPVLAVLAAVVLWCLPFRTTGQESTGQKTTMRRIASVQMSVDSLMRHDAMRTVELMGAQRTKLGKFYSIALHDVVGSLPGVKEADAASVVVVCEASNGQTCAAALAELDPDVTKLPALLLIGPSSSARLDSFALSDVREKKGKVDLTQLEQQFGRVTRLRYVLRDAELDAAERRTFPESTMRMVFPYDRTSFRWLPDIAYVHVYVVQ